MESGQRGGNPALAAGPAAAGPSAPHRALELADYAEMPITADPDGVFYTIHMEDPTTDAPTASPRPGVVPGLDLSGYRTTTAILSPTLPGAVINREAVVIAWTDSDTASRALPARSSASSCPRRFIPSAT